MNITQEEYDKVLKEASELEKRLKKLNYKLERANVVGWEKTEDKVTIGGKITLVANLENWEESREMMPVMNPLYITIEQNKGCGLSLLEMRAMKDYLEEKINYLEDN